MAATSPALLYDAPAGLLCPDTAAPLCTTGATRFPLHFSDRSSQQQHWTGPERKDKVVEQQLGQFYSTGGELL